MGTNSRKQCRQGERCEPRTVDEGRDCLGHHSEYGLPEMCERLGTNLNRARKQFSLYDDEHTLRDREVVAYTLASGDTRETRNYALIDVMCQLLGGMFVPLPRIDAEGHQDVVRHSEQVIKEFGEALAAAGQAVSGGSVTATGAERFEREADDVVRVIVQMVDLMHAKAGTKPLRLVKGA